MISGCQLQRDDEASLGDWADHADDQFVCEHSRRSIAQTQERGKRTNN